MTERPRERGRDSGREIKAHTLVSFLFYFSALIQRRRRRIYRDLGEVALTSGRFPSRGQVAALFCLKVGSSLILIANRRLSSTSANVLVLYLPSPTHTHSLPSFEPVIRFVHIYLPRRTLVETQAIERTSKKTTEDLLQKWVGWLVGWAFLGYFSSHLEPPFLLFDFGRISILKERNQLSVSTFEARDPTEKN